MQLGRSISPAAPPALPLQKNGLLSRFPFQFCAHLSDRCRVDATATHTPARDRTNLVEMAVGGGAICDLLAPVADGVRVEDTILALRVDGSAQGWSDRHGLTFLVGSTKGPHGSPAGLLRYAAGFKGEAQGCRR